MKAILPPAAGALAINFATMMCLHSRDASVAFALQTPRAIANRAARPSLDCLAMSNRGGWDDRPEYGDYNNSRPPPPPPPRSLAQPPSFGEYYSANSNTRPNSNWDDNQQRAYRESKFARDDKWPQQSYNSQTFQRSRMDRGLEGPDPFGGGTGRNNYYEGSTQPPPGRQFGSERGRVREVGRGMLSEDFRNTQRDTFNRGANVGEGYSPEFRRGTRGKRYDNNYRMDAYEERMQPPPLDRRGENYRRPNRNDRGRSPDADYQYYEEPRPRTRRENEGRSPNLSSYRGPEGNDLRNRPFTNQSESFREGQQRPKYDDFREGRSRETSLGRGRSDMRDEPIGFGYRTFKRAVDNLKRAVDRPNYSFSGPDLMREKANMMKDVNRDVDLSMRQDQRSTKALLRDARDFLLADPAVRSMLGDAITVEAPLARTQTSSMVNGVNRSRLQMECPAYGTVGGGRIRFVANDNEITFLEVDTGGRVIDVPLDRRRPPPIDANVMDRDVY